MYQEMEEEPLTFYTRIQHLITLAGYADAVLDQVAETVFMNGVHKEIVLAIRSSPVALNLQQKVDYAHRYWVTRHPSKGVVLPERFKPRRNEERIPTDLDTKARPRSRRPYEATCGNEVDDRRPEEANPTTLTQHLV